MALFPYDKIIVDDLQINNVTSIVTSDTRSLQFLTRRTLGQRYEFVMSCRTLPDNFRAANAYLTSLRGGAELTEIKIPFYGDTSVSNRTAASSAAIGARSITLNSGTSIEAGMYMQFAGHSKMYCVTAISGAVVSFEPNLVRSVASGQVVKFNGIEVSCKLRQPIFSMSSTGNRLPLSFNLSFVEVIS
jgi:hypothetical protein